MPRDYAQKPQPARKRPAPRSRIPRWVWVFTALVAGLFAGGLYLLSQQPAEPDTASTDNGPLPEVRRLLEGAGESASNALSNGQRSDQDEGSSRSREAQLAFYTLLEQTDVLVPDEIVALRQRETLDEAGEEGVEPADPDSRTADEPAGRFIIQVASFQSREDADSLRAELILEGLTSAHITEADLSERGVFYRVMVGPVSSTAETERVGDRLEDLGYQGLVRNQP